MKETYLERMESQLKEWETAIEKLAAKAGQKIQLDDWKSKTAAARTKFEELRSEGEDRWDIVKMGVESAWQELRATYETVTAPVIHEADAPKESASA